jgi:hypothetical protein
MEVRAARRVAMRMEVDAVAHQAAQHVGTEHDQHRADRGLECLLERGRDRMAEPEHRAAEQHQGQRVADAPGDALAQGPGQRALARRQRRDRGQMVRFGRMLHAEQEAEEQDRERRHAGGSNAPFGSI